MVLGLPAELRERQLIDHFVDCLGLETLRTRKSGTRGHTTLLPSIFEHLFLPDKPTC